MPAVLPRVLVDEFSPTELSALRLDGEVRPLADGYLPAGTPEGPRERARGALGARPSRFIIELETAAWVWGALADPPAARHFCVGPHERPRTPWAGTAPIREVMLARSDVADLDGVRVTTPLRTAIDISRVRDDDPEPEVLRCLAAVGAFGVEDCQRLLDRRANLFGKVRAARRLRAALG